MHFAGPTIVVPSSERRRVAVGAHRLYRVPIGSYGLGIRKCVAGGEAWGGGEEKGLNVNSSKGFDYIFFLFVAVSYNSGPFIHMHPTPPAACPLLLKF